jgi:hypothetical protein
MSTIVNQIMSTFLCQPLGLHNIALCKLYYVTYGAPLLHMRMVAAANKLAAGQLGGCKNLTKKCQISWSCAAAAGKLHKKSRCKLQKFWYFTKRKTLDKFKIL